MEIHCSSGYTTEPASVPDMILNYVAGLGLCLRGQSPHPACPTRHCASLSSQHGGGSRKTGRSGSRSATKSLASLGYMRHCLRKKLVCLFFQGEEKEESTQGWEASLDGRKATQLWLLTARLCGYRSAFKCARWPHEIKGLSFIYSWFRFLFFFFPPFF